MYSIIHTNTNELCNKNCELFKLNNIKIKRNKKQLLTFKLKKDMSNKIYIVDCDYIIKKYYYYQTILLIKFLLKKHKIYCCIT